MIKVIFSFLGLMTNPFFHPIDSRKYLGFEQKEHALSQTQESDNHISNYVEPMSLILESEESHTSIDSSIELLDSYPVEYGDEELVGALDTFFLISSRIRSDRLTTTEE